MLSEWVSEWRPALSSQWELDGLSPALLQKEWAKDLGNAAVYGSLKAKGLDTVRSHELDLWEEETAHIFKMNIIFIYKYPTVFKTLFTYSLTIPYF